jgi:hypothetical protein
VTARRARGVVEKTKGVDPLKSECLQSQEEQCKVCTSEFFFKFQAQEVEQSSLQRRISKENTFETI